MVVGVILLLLAVALPTLANARKRGEQTRSMATVRTVAMGLDAYAESHKDVYPVGAGTQPALMQDAWLPVLVEEGHLPNEQAGGGRSGEHNLSNIAPTIAMYAARVGFEPGTPTPFHTLPLVQQRRAQVVWPANKGNVVQVTDGAGRFFCCVDPWPSAVSFFDGSQFFGTRDQLSSAPLVYANAIGAPVMSTWWGLSGVDR